MSFPNHRTTVTIPTPFGKGNPSDMVFIEVGDVRFQVSATKDGKARICFSGPVKVRSGPLSKQEKGFSDYIVESVHETGYDRT